MVAHKNYKAIPDYPEDTHLNQDKKLKMVPVVAKITLNHISVSTLTLSAAVKYEQEE